MRRALRTLNYFGTSTKVGISILICASSHWLWDHCLEEIKLNQSWPLFLGKTVTGSFDPNLSHGTDPLRWIRNSNREISRRRRKPYKHIDLLINFFEIFLLFWSAILNFLQLFLYLILKILILSIHNRITKLILKIACFFPILFYLLQNIFCAMILCRLPCPKILVLQSSNDQFKKNKNRCIIIRDTNKRKCRVRNISCVCTDFFRLCTES